MFMHGRRIVPFFVTLFLISLVIGAGVWAYNAGASQGSFLGLETSPVVAGLLAVLLLLFVVRLAAQLVLMPLFGLGFMGWRRRFGHGWGHHGRKHGWKRGWDDKQGKWSKEDWEEGVPPMVAEWHRRLHAMPAEGEGPQAPA
ncbi:MAG TPA: hypothetical protein VGA52_01105 [Anaerolineales bacterium]|jgi:hypothetical protein